MYEAVKNRREEERDRWVMAFLEDWRVWNWRRMVVWEGLARRRGIRVVEWVRRIPVRMPEVATPRYFE